MFVLAFTAFPALARWTFAPGFASSAVGVARHILLRWALRLVRVYWFNPRAAARAQRWEAATDELNQLLGRYATPEEFLEHWRRTQAAWKAAGRPR